MLCPEPLFAVGSSWLQVGAVRWWLRGVESVPAQQGRPCCLAFPHSCTSSAVSFLISSLQTYRGVFFPYIKILPSVFSKISGTTPLSWHSWGVDSRPDKSAFLPLFTVPMHFWQQEEHTSPFSASILVHSCSLPTWMALGLTLFTARLQWGTAQSQTLRQ